MAASETLNTGKEKLDNWLKQKNFFTDVLEKVESKTGVKRIYIFVGENVVVGVFLCCRFSPGEIHVGAFFRFGGCIRPLSCLRLWGRSYSYSAWICLSCLPIVSIFFNRTLAGLTPISFVYLRYFAFIY